MNKCEILARIISTEKSSYFCSPESGMSDVWASWKDCKKILIDGKSVDRFWVVFEKYFWREKAEERWLIRKASVTDSCLILDTLAACCNIHWTDSILCSICKVFVKYLCCFFQSVYCSVAAGTWQRRKIYILFSAKTAKSGSTKSFTPSPADDDAQRNTRSDKVQWRAE